MLRRIGCDITHLPPCSYYWTRFLPRMHRYYIVTHPSSTFSLWWHVKTWTFIRRTITSSVGEKTRLLIRQLDDSIIEPRRLPRASQVGAFPKCASLENHGYLIFDTLECVHSREEHGRTQVSIGIDSDCARGDWANTGQHSRWWVYCAGPSSSGLTGKGTTEKGFLLSFDQLIRTTKAGIN